ncbi:hypothetical protein DPMN_014085 [Dreissena polymorpha]|uniref:Uncharacterized protein n=1 Tax=Dreissena polymorpha TaxID=45954 RepID=A0A9D4N8R6_DREPO|nr:hypothetical protein DPMN_014085 [Dreissena polymorpha]
MCESPRQFLHLVALMVAFSVLELQQISNCFCSDLLPATQKKEGPIFVTLQDVKNLVRLQTYTF